MGHRLLPKLGLFGLFFLGYCACARVCVRVCVCVCVFVLRYLKVTTNFKVQRLLFLYSPPKTSVLYYKKKYIIAPAESRITSKLRPIIMSNRRIPSMAQDTLTRGEKSE